MKDIKLSEYQNTSIYFYLFDAIIKNKNLNKDEFLISIGISPTSYRRARKSEQAIGHEIIKILADYFNYRLLTHDEQIWKYYLPIFIMICIINASIIMIAI